MPSLKIAAPRIEADDASPIFSHQSHEPDVHAICHHSGAYLTRGETNPHPRALLREQHDFPGLPALDRSFGAAAHAGEHQHLSWSPVAVQALGLILSALLIALLVRAVARYDDFMPAGVALMGTRALLAIAGLAAAGLFGWALALLAQRESLYHTKARGLPPAVPDYPVACTYEIDATERVNINIGNGLDNIASIDGQDCRLDVHVQPERNDLEDYGSYRSQYDGLQVGAHVRAGVVAIEGLRNVVTGAGFEHGHRIVLRKPAAEAVTGDSVHEFSILAPYGIREDVLHEGDDEERRCILSCRPELSPDNSRRLTICFDWRGPANLPNLGLDYCQLDVPRQLRVLQVMAGRYDADANTIVWRNLAFSDTGLKLEIDFAEPIVEYQDQLEHITGKFRISFDGLLSGLQISADRVWTAWGLKASENAVIIHRLSVLTGTLALDLRRLAYEHEYAAGVSLACDGAPDDVVVREIARVLEDRGVDLVRIVEAAPRLNPAGALNTSLHYWEITGRAVDQDRLDVYDVHVVVSGHGNDPLARTHSRRPPATQVDVRVRCAHDPRNKDTAKKAEDLLCLQDKDGLDLAGRIAEEIRAARAAS